MTDTPPPAADDREPRRAADSSERAYAALRQALIDFRFAPGERIRELRMAQELGMSRSPVREALNRLASEGFVMLLPNTGFCARSFELPDLMALYDLRKILETAAFERMCRHASDAQLAAISAFWDSVQHVYARHDADAILTADEQFHLMIAEASGNGEIVEILRTVNARLRFVRRLLITHDRHDSDLATGQQALVTALLARDAVGGRALMESHIALTYDVARDALSEALARQKAQRAATKPTPRRRRKPGAEAAPIPQE